MENPTNPKNSSIRQGHSAELSRSPQDDAELVEASNFIEDLQKASKK